MTLLNKIKMEQITCKILNEFYVIKTLTKLLYCSSLEESTMFLLQDTASPAHISYLQYNLKL